MRDLEKSVSSGAELKPHQNALKEWLGQLEPKVLSGEIASSKELYHTLFKSLEGLYDSTSIHISTAAPPPYFWAISFSFIDLPYRA